MAVVVVVVVVEVVVVVVVVVVTCSFAHSIFRGSRKHSKGAQM